MPERPEVLEVTVIGAGVIGLTTALRLCEEVQHVHVRVIADRFDEDTTSAGAAGLWEPYKLSDTPPELIRRWGQETFQHLQRLLVSPEAASCGVSETVAHQFWTKDMEDPEWKDIVPHFRHMSAEELAPYNLTAGGIYKHAWAFSTLICEGRKYLQWLRRRFLQAGGKIVHRKVKNLKEVSGSAVVVNCTGLGSVELFGDKSMYPIRGHVIRVYAPWIKGIYFCDEQTYIIPNEDSVVLGGTGYIGEWRTEVWEEDHKSILARTSQMMPSLAEAAEIRDWVGLRPGRPSVRLEEELIPCTGANRGVLRVVHNYGHGGAGLTLAWGCAGHAVELVSKLLKEQYTRSKM